MVSAMNFHSIQIFNLNEANSLGIANNDNNNKLFYSKKRRMSFRIYCKYLNLP
jgi:hypothetical protein